MLNELKSFGLGTNPLHNFENWYKEALSIEDNADAMTLGTYDLDLKRPVNRTILYKGLKDSKIIFYTNYLSHKGQHLEQSPEVSLLFYWHKSIKQVRIQGHVTKSSAIDSDLYFKSRDRDSQLASYISHQSAPIESKEELIKKLSVAKEKFNGVDVPRPEHWGGYLVEPYEFEFFIYGKNRLNDRFLFEKNGNDWKISRLQP